MKFHALASAILVVGLGGCARHHVPESLPTTAARTSLPSASLTNGQIIDLLLRAHASEVTEGSVVAVRSTNASIREFANRMINDHTEARRELQVFSNRREIERAPRSIDLRRVLTRTRALLEQHLAYAHRVEDGLGP